MANIAYLPSIPDVDFDFESPIASIVFLNKYRDGLRLVQGLLEDKPALILQGVLDETPPTQANSYIVDSNPTAGTINRNDKFNGITLEITSGAAVGEYVITDTDSGLNRITVVEDLGSLGASTGDSYQLRGHSHNGFDSEKVDVGDVTGLTGLNVLPVGTVAMTKSGSCPSGWSSIDTSHSTKFTKGGPTSGPAGSETHGHAGGGTIGFPNITGTDFRPNLNGTSGSSWDWLLITVGTNNLFNTGRHTHTGGPAPSSSFDSLDLLSVRFRFCVLN